MIDEFTRRKVASRIHERTTQYVTREKLAIRVFGHEWDDLMEPEKVVLNDLVKRASVYTVDEFGSRKFAGIATSFIESLIGKGMGSLGKFTAEGAMTAGRALEAEAAQSLAQLGKIAPRAQKGIGRFNVFKPTQASLDAQRKAIESGVAEKASKMGLEHSPFIGPQLPGQTAGSNWAWKASTPGGQMQSFLGGQGGQALQNWVQLATHYAKQNPLLAAGVGGAALLASPFLLRAGRGFAGNVARGMMSGGVQQAAKPLMGTGTKLMLGVGGAGALAYGVGGGLHSRISNDRQMAAMQDPQAYGMYMGYNPEQKV